jgi:N-acyl-D-amino-acid deacylase
MYSSLDELAAFCAVASAADKPVTVHLKALSRVSPCYPLTTPRAHNVRALKEMLSVAEQTGARLQLSHFIFVGRRSWGTAPECLRLVAEARERGLDVMIDAFPYTCGNTTINAILPYWFLRRLPEAYDSRAARARLRLELEIGFRLVGFGLSDLQVMDVGIEGKEALNGRRIDEIARDWERSPLDVLLTLSRESRGAATMLLHTYSGDDDDERILESVLQDDFCLFETDAVVRRQGYPNPAALGTFPRILGRYSRERGLFPLEEAVRRMTSASATRFGLTERGLLEKGKAADVVVFAPDTVADAPPRGTEPAGPPAGIEYVFLNGREVVRGDRCLDVPPAGRVLTT